MNQELKLSYGEVAPLALGMIRDRANWSVLQRIINISAYRWAAPLLMHPSRLHS